LNKSLLVTGDGDRCEPVSAEVWLRSNRWWDCSRIKTAFIDEENYGNGELNEDSLGPQAQVVQVLD